MINASNNNQIADVLTEQLGWASVATIENKGDQITKIICYRLPDETCHLSVVQHEVVIYFEWFKEQFEKRGYKEGVDYLIIENS